MLEEYDTVRLTTPLAHTPVPVGAKGTVLLVFREPREAYEVEFLSKLGHSLGTFTVEREQLEPWREPFVLSEPE